MTKRIKLVFDLPDNDVKQVEDMLSDILATFDGEVFLFSVGEIPDNLSIIWGDIVEYSAEGIVEIFGDTVMTSFLPNFKKHKGLHDDTKILQTITDLEIMLNFIGDQILSDLSRR